jgi:DNA-binding LytR/AlgR family response regulator
MPTALIADDEPLLAEDLRRRLQAVWPALQVIAVVGNGVDALAGMNRSKPDFAFLDIRMPGLDGLQVAAAAGPCRVVFVTAYDEYALAAFEAAAVDYLLKPVSDLRLAQCVGRLQRDAETRIDLEALARTLAPRSPEALSWLPVGLGATTRLVSIDEVLYFRSSDKYTEVVTAHERHLIRTPLKALLPQLPSGRFAQIHRGVIVSLAAVANIERDLLGRAMLHLRDRQEVLPVSRGYAARFHPL